MLPGHALRRKDQSELPRLVVDAQPSSADSSRFKCGEVPRKTLVKQKLIPLSLANIRCPRGQDGDQTSGETYPTELEFLTCGLVSTRKFVVWTPHGLVQNQGDLHELLTWARQHTDCDFSVADECEQGFLLHHGHERNTSQARCLPDFDITAQPSRHRLVDVAIKVFEATAMDKGTEGLSHLEAEMAYGVVLGYPKYSTREYLLNGPWKEQVRSMDFDAGYQRAVDWVLGHLEECCAGTELYENIRGWPETTASGEGDKQHEPQFTANHAFPW